ncbi:MAG TPA: CBS domain-containing protein [Candidatus Omnitrophota bacterium]|nr:CBS domain-containing protein [Candidatus Omnitrophota bacterium]
MPSLTAQDVLTPHAVMISEEMYLFEVAGVLRTRRIGGAPVVNKDGALVGVITVTDLFKFIQKLRARIKETDRNAMDEIHQKRLKTRVSDVMPRNVLTVRKDTPLNEVMDLMMEKNVHTIPVLAEDGKEIAGVIGRHDLSLVYMIDQSAL